MRKRGSVVGRWRTRQLASFEGIGIGVGGFGGGGRREEARVYGGDG